MKGLIRFIKSLFGKYESGYEYWIRLKDIKIPFQYRFHKIGKAKWNRKMKFWLKTGEFESPIILNKDFTLVDGYSSFRIAETKDIDSVPVYFVDWIEIS